MDFAAELGGEHLGKDEGGKMKRRVLVAGGEAGFPDIDEGLPVQAISGL